MFDRSDGRSLRSAFLQHASKRPDAPAVVVRGVTRSYAELETTARRWANAIIGIGRSRPERVGVFAYRSEVSYCGTLAALFSGATFVPLNPTFPDSKTASMIRQADLDAIIVDKICASHLPAVLAGISAPPLLMPEFDSAGLPGVDTRILKKTDLDSQPPVSQMPPLVPDDVAYLLFTSGSTGDPKGVPVTHGNAVYFMDVMTERYGIRPDDRFSQTFDQTFDLSVFDLFIAWSSGACVYSASTVELLDPRRFVNRNELTVWFSVPSVAAHMMRRNTLLPGTMPSLRWSLFCGEPLPRRSAEAWQAAAPNSVLENLYGPTELTIACLVHRWDPDGSPQLCQNDLVPIGRPYPGLGVTVIGEDLQPARDGEVGELCVAGPQTTPGYWRDSAKTAQRYIELPISSHQSRRFYRTGDRVVRLEGGEYIFCGRMDDQIKVLGHRVEVGEIEAALRAQAGVEHAVAFGWPIVDGAAQGIVAMASGEGLDSGTLIEQAKQALPPYAVPARVFILPEMPLNANGKINRRALRERLAEMAGDVSEPVAR
jgi:amino acid adenylation domain-containing protein